MSDFDNYPYNEQHELNLDPTLKTLKEDKTKLEETEAKFNNDVETAIDNDNKKLDDSNTNADTISQKADAVNQKADEVNQKSQEVSDKIDNNKQKQEETTAQLNDTVTNAYYENELTPEELKSSKKLGTFNVAKVAGVTSQEVRATTPTGVLGNCVVWASSPFTFVNTNSQILTDQDFSESDKIIQYQCNGSFFIFNSFDNTKRYFLFGANGHSVASYFDGDNFNPHLTTNGHLDLLIDTAHSDKYTVILPKTGNTTFDGGYEQFTDIRNNTVITTKPVTSSNHLYVYYGYEPNHKWIQVNGYIYNGELKKTSVSDKDDLDVTYSDNIFTIKTATSFSSNSMYDDSNYTFRLYFVDLGEM